MERSKAVIVSHLTKIYTLGQFNHNSLKRELESRRARRKGREDPNSIIGSRTGTFTALDDVSFDVYEGEIFGIIGRNGRGKSTLLKVMSEITAPTKGTIAIKGKVSSLLEVGSGFDRELTGRENIYLNGSILGMSKAEIDSKIEDIIAFSEVGEFIDTPVKRYSSGMFVKLAFSVAAHLDNDIMVLDEILAVGDQAFRSKSIEKIRSKADEGRTVLYVSHNMNYIRQVCDRCAVLDKGKLVFIGETESAINYYLRNILVADTRRELEGMPRSARLTDRRMILTSAEYPGRDNITFTSQEKMTVRLHWKDLKDYTGLCLRSEVWTVDDRHLASYPLENICDGKEGLEHRVDIDYDISVFTPGTYKFKYTFYFPAPNGTVIDTDRVIGLFFEVKRRENTVWDSGNWGYIRLGGAKIHEDRR